MSRRYGVEIIWENEAGWHTEFVADWSKAQERMRELRETFGRRPTWRGTWRKMEESR